MLAFLLGLAIFFCTHVVTVTPLLRRAVFGSLTDSRRKMIVAILSLAGIVLICTGWPATSANPVFSPVLPIRSLAPWLVSVALVLVLTGGLRLRACLRRYLHHPMLIGVALWSAVHLMANGGLRETLLFGGFLVFSLYALAVAFGSGRRADFSPSPRWDVLGVVLGLAVAGGVMHAHHLLFGVVVTG